MTPRWKIKFKYADGSVAETKLYNQSKQAAYDSWSKGFEIISIEEDTGTSYVGFINQIKSRSELIEKNDKRQLYKYPNNDSFILVRLYTNGEEYYDYCEFQRWDCRGLQNPILWSVSNPKDFCELFENDVEQLPQGYVVTPNEIKKIKAKKFYNKNGEVLWIDESGYIYNADKIALSNKYNKSEWERFHDNANAVLVRYGIAGKHRTKWFESEEEFLKFYHEEKKDVPAYYETPFYEIRQKGYSKKKPEDRKAILRLPYINLDMELAYGTPAEDIALCWSKMCDRSWQANNLDCYDFLIGVVKHYKEWLLKNQNTN